MSDSTSPAPEPATIYEMYRHRLERDPDREFLIVPDGRSWTFRDVAERVDLLAARLAGLGVRPGDMVGLYLWNEPAWFVAVLATWQCGGIAAICGAVSPPGEAQRRFRVTRAVGVVAAADAPQLGGDWPVVNVDESGALAGETQASALVVPSLRPGPQDAAAVWFTSGTTGDAKGIVKTQHDLVWPSRRTAATYSRSPDFRPRVADPSKPPAISFNPFGQVASFGRLMFYLYIGRGIVLVRKFNVETFNLIAKRYHPDTLQLTPAMVHMLAYADGEVEMSGVKYVTCGSAPLSVASRDAFESRFGIPVLQAFGSTEGGVMALETYEDVKNGLRGPGAVGRITPESVWRIVTPDGQDVVPGEAGEILGKPGSQAIITAEGAGTLPLDEHGWYHTGDMGRVDEHGILYLTGRIKELLIVGGFNVYPAEVEDILRSFSEVRDALVVPVPDERLGEIPAAGIVWAEPASPDETDARFYQLSAAAREQLAAYKVPRLWFGLQEVPLTPNGKPDRAAASRLAESEGKSTADLAPSAQRELRGS